MSPSDLSARIKQRAHELGFSGCGILTAEPIGEFTSKLEERIRRFPDSQPLYEPLRPYAHPRERALWARSLIICTMPYNRYSIPNDLDHYFGKMYLCDVRVTYSPEYERIAAMEAFLQERGMQTFGGLITARWTAAISGLGRFGKNNFLYTKQDGSWVWLQTWLVDAELACDTPAQPECACPPGCRRCIDACPTGALSEPFCMDRGRCIAQLSYYTEKLPSEALRSQMSLWLYGCDVCQNVCPLNKGKWRDSAADFPGLNELAKILQPETILAMDEEVFKKKIQPRFWYIPPEKFWLWRCNALRAMANSKNNHHYAELVRKALTDSNIHVRQMAGWAYRKIMDTG